MFYGVKNQVEAGAVPLISAVLCVDCESVSDSRSDECPVCGSHSVLSVARLVGGTLTSQQARSAPKDGSVLFDLKITIDLQKLEAKELNIAVETLTGLIGPKLGRAGASFHINVEPVVDPYAGGEETAA